MVQQIKPSLQMKANDENALFHRNNAKIDLKPSNAFNVLKLGDENAPPTIHVDETDHAVPNSSFSGLR